MKYWRYLRNEGDTECSGVYGHLQGVFDDIEDALPTGLKDNDVCFILEVENDTPVKEHCWIGNDEWVESDIVNGKVYALD